VNADAKFDPAFGREFGGTFPQAGLQFPGALQRIDGAAELGQQAVTGSLDDPAVMGGHGRIDQLAADRPEPI
jgi:hypothetical protein